MKSTRAVALAACTAVALAMAGVGTAQAAVPTGDPTTYSTYPAIQDPGSRAADYFQPYWFDDKGAHIQAHGGQIVTAQELGVTGDGVTSGVESGRTVYYWYGEDRTNGYYGSPGVHAYKSYDTLNWTDEGVVLRAVSSASELTSPYFDALYDTVDDAGNPRADRIAQLDYHLDTADAADHTTVFERPKVLYNKSTRTWVLWWHSDGQTTPGGSMYARSMAGVAVSDSPTGPFTMVGVYRLPNRTNYKDCISAAVPGQARDMTVFQDADGTAYISYSSEENRSLYVAKLDSSYTNVTHTTNADQLNAGQYSADGRYPYIFADGTAAAPVRGQDFQIVKECGMLEAPALFAHGGKYYAVASGATGWGPNPQTYYTADSVLGAWIRGVDPNDPYENVAYNSIPEGGDGLLSIGDTRRTTFGSQTASVLDLGGGRYVYLGDRWDSGAADSTYVALPITFGENGRAEMRNPATEDPARWARGWDATYWDDKGLGNGIWSVGDTGLPTTIEPGMDFGARLPVTVPVTSGGSTAQVGVTWSATSFTERGSQTITGTLGADAQFTAGRTFTRTIMVATPGIVNLAPQATVAASSRNDMAPSVVDGNVKGKGWDNWVGGGAYPASSWLSFSWPLAEKVDEIDVHTYKDGSTATWPSSIAVEYVDASGAWRPSTVHAALAQDASASAPVAKLDLTGLPLTNGIRLQLSTATNTWQSISEVQIWGADGVTDLCSVAGTTVSASFFQTEWATMPAQSACDRNAATSWSTWTGGTPVSAATFTVEPATAQIVDRVGFTNIEGTITGVSVDYRDAQGTWHSTSARNQPPHANGLPTTVSFAPVFASAVRVAFATPGSYLKIPVLAVGAAKSTVVPSVAVHCTGSQIVFKTTVQNTAYKAADITITTPFGTKTADSVAPGTSSTIAFPTHTSSIGTGETTFSVDDATVTVGYPAATCQ
ncbi:glycoside hydrolase family 43 protein [Microbacterium panaciterrae]|uniref:F5/8 type C domain-containing protein n=1 Tax=Microbacterium panaciterrae TaxID=985759 RepID=A0ABP8PCH4_9MICO